MMKPKHPLDIVMYTEGLPMDGDTWKRQSLGGSETAAAMMCRHLAARGHAATLYCKCPRPGIYDGVRYQDVAAFEDEQCGNEPDVLVMSRNFHHIAADWLTPKSIYVWNHDILLPEVTAVMERLLPLVDRYIFNSEFHKKQCDDLLHLAPDFYCVSRNGVDVSTVEKACRGVERDPNRCIYTSRPDRGLDILLSIWPRLKVVRPELELYVAWYSHPEADRGHLAPMLAQVDTELDKQGIHRLPPLKKADLYRELAKSNLLLYPSTFWETSCIAAIEGMACGCVPVSSKYCALMETVKDRETGVLIPGDPHSPGYQEEYVSQTLMLLEDGPRLEAIRERAMNWGRTHFDYRAIAAEWEAEFYRFFDSQPREERFHGLYWRGDVLGARAAGADIANAPRYAGQNFDWIDDPERYHQHYLASYDGPPKAQGRMRPDVVQSRLRWLITELGRRPEVNRLLDVGCSWGDVASIIEEATEGGIEIVCTDVNDPVIHDAPRLCETWTAHADKIKFLCMAADICDTADLGGEFDALWLGEILEHVPKPDEFVAGCLRHVKPGGWILITVPWGPWDLSRVEKPYLPRLTAGHIHHYSRRDLAELLSDLEDVSLQWLPGLLSSRTCRNEPCGYWCAVARKPVDCGKALAVPAPDLSRRARLVRGRQGISACFMIGGPAENSLHRCLRSMRPFVDQICISYTNASAESRRIAHEYADYEQDIPWLEADGLPDFGAARNASIAPALEDWILWLDTDEVLKGGEHFWRLCRRNQYNGYLIPQIHVQLDAQIEPDLPVRLFRNGLGIRFFGSVHEHPEMALNHGVQPATLPRGIGGAPLMRIAHDGYLTERDRRGRFHRNLPLLRKSLQKYPGRLLDQATYFRDLVQEVLLAGQHNTPQGRAQLTEALAYWRECGMDKPTDPRRKFVLAQYEQALAALGMGLDIRVAMAVSPGQAETGPKAELRARVADAAEANGLMAEMLRSLEGQVNMANFRSQFPFEK